MAVRKLHREHAPAIGLKDRARLEIAADRHHVTVSGRRVWEVETRRYRLYRHGFDCVRCAP